MWNSGSTQITRSITPSRRLGAHQMLEDRHRRGEIAVGQHRAFGRPVVPPVYCSSAMSSGDTLGHAAGFGASLTKSA